MTAYSNLAPLRLTRRGKRLIIAAALGLVLVISAPAITSLAEATNQSAAPEQISALITIQPGDTLWEIAGRIAPDRDPREVIWELKQLNPLPAGLIAGDQLRIPLN
jgi:Tfp pilus assembly protein FimV